MPATATKKAASAAEKIQPARDAIEREQQQRTAEHEACINWLLSLPPDYVFTGTDIAYLEKIGFNLSGHLAPQGVQKRIAFVKAMFPQIGTAAQRAADEAALQQAQATADAEIPKLEKEKADIEAKMDAHNAALGNARSRVDSRNKACERARQEDVLPPGALAGVRQYEVTVSQVRAPLMNLRSEFEKIGRVLGWNPNSVEDAERIIAYSRQDWRRWGLVAQHPSQSRVVVLTDSFKQHLDELRVRREEILPMIAELEDRMAAIEATGCAARDYWIKRCG
jgi:hypothetical protein